MKTASNDLHEIIHSLSPGEKRYFRQFASRHIIGGQNNYLALFDAVARQESYDEAALKQSLCDTSFVQYFPVAKRYLHQQIVESLYWFHRANSMEAQVQKNLLAADILLDKGLIGQSKKLLKKARKDIYACELFRLLPDLLERERAIMDRTLYKGATAQDLDDWEAEWNRALDSLQQEGRYACWSSSVAQLHYQKVAVRERSFPERFEPLLGIAPADAGLSLRAQLDYYKAMSTWHFMNGNAEAACDCNRDLLQVLDDHPFLMEQYPRRYLTALNNFLIDNHQLKRYEALENGIAKLKALPQRQEFRRIPQLSEKIFELSTLLELNAWVGQAHFEAALNGLPAIQEGLTRYGKGLALHHKLTFYYLMAYIYFENKRYDDALTWLNEVVQQPLRDVVEELLRFANLLKLLTHFELGHYDLLEYLINTVRRQHGMKGSLYQTEKLLFSFLKKLINATEGKRQQELFSGLYGKLELAKADPEERRVFNYFDFLRWAARKQPT